MKHPKYRVADILFLHPDVRRELFSWAWNLCHTLPIPIKDVQLVGSLAFGVASIRSDIDFNISCKDWNDQVPARRWFYSADNRKPISDACIEFESKWGVKVDIGCVDCETEQYNIFASVKHNTLHNRGIDPLPDYTPNFVAHDPVLKTPITPIDLNTFNPLTDPIPPTTTMHLKFDNYAFRWLCQQRNFERKGDSGEDNWASEVKQWRVYYGLRFLEP